MSWARCAFPFIAEQLPMCSTHHSAVDGLLGCVQFRQLWIQLPNRDLWVGMYLYFLKLGSVTIPEAICQFLPETADILLRMMYLFFFFIDSFLIFSQQYLAGFSRPIWHLTLVPKYFIFLMLLYMISKILIVQYMWLVYGNTIHFCIFILYLAI